MIKGAVALCLLALSASAAEVRVRLGTTHDLRSVEVRANPTATVQRCAGCRFRRLEQSLIVASRGERLLVHGRYFSKINVLGQWKVTFADGAVATGHWPVTITGSGDSVAVMARMPLEDYVAQVLDAEAGTFKSAEARRAMAVVVRTYALAFQGRHKSEGFDLCDSTHCQALRFDTASAESRNAAESTEGELLWYRGTLAHTYYHRNCGGMLEEGRALEGTNVPYLASKPDAYCIRHAEEWRSEPSRADVARALAGIGVMVGKGFHLDIASRTATGRVQALRISNNGREQVVPEPKFRWSVLRTIGWSTIQSDWYELRVTGETAVFTGRGRGHGVGLCQSGSEQRGAAGNPYHEILAFYYPGTRASINASGISWRYFAGQRVELLTTDERDQALIATAENILGELERSAGWTVGGKPLIKIFPTVEMYRDATGAPGWLAAETRGRAIRFQPMRGWSTVQLHDTLRHELAHVLISAEAHVGLQRWFQEGLAAVLSKPPDVRGFRPGRLESLDASLLSSDPGQRRSAYATSALAVQNCIRKSGREAVLGWIRKGLPADLNGACGIGR